MRYGLRILLLLLAVQIATSAAGEETLDDPGTRALRLDALFEELLRSDETRATEIQSEIVTIWNDPGSPGMRLIFLRAQRAMEAGDLAVATDHLDDLVRLAPEFAEGWNARATVRYYSGNYAGSLADIRETLLREPRHFGALSGLGLVLIALGNAPRALEAYRAALAIHPHLAGAKIMIERLRSVLERDA